MVEWTSKHDAVCFNVWNCGIDILRSCYTECKKLLIQSNRPWGPTAYQIRCCRILYR